MYLKNKLIITNDISNYSADKALAKFSASILQKNPPALDKYTPEFALTLTIYQAIVDKINLIYSEKKDTLPGHPESLKIKMSESYSSDNRKINDNELQPGLWLPEQYIAIKKAHPEQQLEGNCVEISYLMLQLLKQFNINATLYMPNKANLHVYLLLKLDNIIYQLNPKTTCFALRPEQDAAALYYYQNQAKTNETILILKFYDGLIKYRQGYTAEAQDIFRELVKTNNRWYIFEQLALIAAQQKKYLASLNYFELAEASNLPEEKLLSFKEKKDALKNFIKNSNFTPPPGLML